MNNPTTENSGADTDGLAHAQCNEPCIPNPQSSLNLQEGYSTFNIFYKQQGIRREAVQTSGSMQACPLAKGIYVGPCLKDIPGSVSISTACLQAPSERHGTEVAVKDLSTFLGSSYSTVFSETLGPIIPNMRSPDQLTGATWHRQTPELHQNFPNHMGRDLGANGETLTQGPLKVLRPPGDGKGKSHMLPRYWPRMTEKELRLLSSRDSNSTIIPLFEKVLSASDAGKVGRLVLPKACAELYFPYISQPEGVPLNVQDTNGREWVFQFRFWPNNNSRMYVLEGITPCIHSMNLQAGDTVVFSRLDPEGKLVMGYRRAPTILCAEDMQKPVIGATTVPTCLKMVAFGGTQKASFIPSLTRLLTQTEESCIRGTGNNKLGQCNVAADDNGNKLCCSEKLKPKFEGDLVTELVIREKRKAMDAVSMTKRYQVDFDKEEFRKNWESLQTFLQSPPSATPTIVTIDGYDFEEYEEPPILGKDILGSTPPTRSICSELDTDEGENSSYLQHVKAIKKDLKNDICMDNKKYFKGEVNPDPGKRPQPYSGLETLASVATSEETTGDSAGMTTAMTTKHPRHRPGCSCIVCIQPPSGQGPKHRPNCECNVCSTVKRRFQTLMLRRKKLQSERAAESAAQRNSQHLVDSSILERKSLESGMYQTGSWQKCMSNSHANTLSQIVEEYSNGNQTPSGFSTIKPHFLKEKDPEFEELGNSKGSQLDLNSHPDREEEMNRQGLPSSMKGLLQSAGYSLDIYLKEQGLTSLVCHEQNQETLERSIGDVPIPQESDHDYSLSAVVFSNSRAEPTFHHSG